METYLLYIIRNGKTRKIKYPVLLTRIALESSTITEGRQIQILFRWVQLISRVAVAQQSNLAALAEGEVLAVRIPDTAATVTVRLSIGTEQTSADLIVPTSGTRPSNRTCVEHINGRMRVNSTERENQEKVKIQSRNHG